MAISDYVSELGLGTGSVSTGLTIITWVIVILVVVVLVGIAVYLLILSMKFKKRIVVFENLSGQGFVPTFKDRAMTVKLGSSGSEVLYLLKKKVYRVAYGKRMGKNIYWFAIGDDGYWYNVTLENLDDTFKRLKFKPVDTNMRYAYDSIQKAIRDRYDKIGFWSKYGGLIMSIGAFAIIIVLNWLLFREYFKVSDSLNAAISTAAEVLKETKKILGTLDNLQSASGVRIG